MDPDCVCTGPMGRGNDMLRSAHTRPMDILSHPHSASHSTGPTKHENERFVTGSREVVGLSYASATQLHGCQLLPAPSSHTGKFASWPKAC